MSSPVGILGACLPHSPRIPRLVDPGNGGPRDWWTPALVEPGTSGHRDKWDETEGVVTILTLRGPSATAGLLVFISEVALL